MTYLQHGVLVLHNIPPQDGTSAAAAAVHRESDASVMDQVVAVGRALDKCGLRYRIVGLRDLRSLPEILATAPERIVFNLVETFPDCPADAVLVPAVCLAHGKMCTGSFTAGLLLSTDKWLTKVVLRDAKLPVPEGVVIPPGHKVRPSLLPPPPLIVKPLAADASEGIDYQSVVEDTGPALLRAINRVHTQFAQPALVERFVGHRELNVALFETRRSVRVLPLAEIVFTAFAPGTPRIVDYASKWLPDTFQYQNTPRVIPAQVSQRVAREAREYALRAWQLLGCRDYARVDLRLNRNGELFVIEVNANPDISPEAGYMAALEAANIDFPHFVRRICLNASARLQARFGVPEGKRSTPARRPQNAAIRRTRAADTQRILNLVRDTGYFRPVEIEVAEEVLKHAASRKRDTPYQSYALTLDAEPVGWVCFGATPCTVGCFDLYWLVVHPRHQSRGFGRLLLQFAERRIRKRGGRMIVVETSSRPLYDITRTFYTRMGYELAARVRDFYAPGDDRIIYAKRLHPPQNAPHAP